jgi:hypothetical protein
LQAVPKQFSGTAEAGTEKYVPAHLLCKKREDASKNNG